LNIKTNIIFHIPQPLSPNPVSGSDLRPVMMINSFKKYGNVYDVSGILKARKQKIRSIKKLITKGIIFDFVYSESSTMPTAMTETHHFPLNPFLDLNFLRFCRRKGIPVVLFYRDMHWKFDHHKKKVKLWKRLLAYPFYKLDLHLYNTFVDIMYLPSLKMIQYIPKKLEMVIKTLPPATFKPSKIISRKHEVDCPTINLSYVGGIGDLYQIDLLIHVVQCRKDKYRLFINTRQEDWRNFKSKYKGNIGKNIIISHNRFIDLPAFYINTDIACIYVKPIEYWSFVMPLKLFEAISYLKPIIAPDGTAVGDFIRENDIGWVIKYDKKELLHKLDNITLSDIETKKSNLQLVRDNNTWENRCEQVIGDIKTRLTIKKPYEG